MSNTLLVNLLLKSGFTRTEHEESFPLIIHAVAGGGKSTLLRKLTAFYSVYSPASPAQSSLRGDHFSPEAAGSDIIDEYQSCAELPPSAIALVGDPLQDPSHQRFFKPHFLKTTSYRVGPSVAAALKEIVPIEALGSSSLQCASAYQEDPVGLVIAFQPEVCTILKNHQVEHSHPHEIRGVEVPVVTVYTVSSLVAPKSFSDFYVALTRASSKVLWLTLDAPDSGHPAADQ